MIEKLKDWERAKVNMRSVNDSCRVDISELSSSVLEIDMAALDNARGKMNADGVVRAVYGILYIRDRISVTRHTFSEFVSNWNEEL